MWWILLVLYVLLFMFNMSIEIFTEFYKIRYKYKEFDTEHFLICFLFSITPLLNIIAMFCLIPEVVETFSGRSIKEWIEKLCRTGLK